MYTTNVDPSAPLSSGLLLPSNQPRNYYARKIVEELVNAQDSPWAEVTGDSPTPAWLQDHASTITSEEGTSSATDGSAHVTLYYTADPRLEDEKTVLLRFFGTTRGLFFGFKDSSHGDSSDASTYHRMMGSNTSLSSSSQGAFFLINSDSVSTSDGGDTGTSWAEGGPWRFLYWMWDDMLMMGCLNNANDIILGITLIVIPNDGGWVPSEDASINCFGMIPYYFTSAYSQVTTSSILCYPQIGASAPAVSSGLYGSHRGSHTYSSMPDGRLFVDQATLYLPNAGQVYVAPRIRKCFPTRNNFDIVTIEEDDWMYFDNGGTHPILIKLGE